jgi:hypothetical protein
MRGGVIFPYGGNESAVELNEARHYEGGLFLTLTNCFKFSLKPQSEEAQKRRSTKAKKHKSE